MNETEIEKLKRLRLPKIKGTWNEIVKMVGEFYTEEHKLIFFSSTGFLIKFIGVKDHYTPYIFTEKNINNLYFRKRDHDFYIIGDHGGSSDINDQWNYIFELVEIPKDTLKELDLKRFRNSYNVSISERKIFSFY